MLRGAGRRAGRRGRLRGEKAPGSFGVWSKEVEKVFEDMDGGDGVCDDEMNRSVVGLCFIWWVCFMEDIWI